MPLEKKTFARGLRCKYVNEHDRRGPHLPRRPPQSRHSGPESGGGGRPPPRACPGRLCDRLRPGPRSHTQVVNQDQCGSPAQSWWARGWGSNPLLRATRQSFSSSWQQNSCGLESPASTWASLGLSAPARRRTRPHAAPRRASPLPARLPVPRDQA